MSQPPPENKRPSIIVHIMVCILSGVVMYQSWKAGERLGDSFPFQLGLVFALSGVYAVVRELRLQRAERKKALPAAPAEFNGIFAPDFRRYLEKLHQALGPDSPEMVLEEDYAFWYNPEVTIELALAPQGWIAFFLIRGGEYNMERPLVQRAVADSPFATHPVAQEMLRKYAELPLSGIAWCCNNTVKVYPYTTTHDFTTRFAGNLFAPAQQFDAWLNFYLATGFMSEEI